MAICYLKLVLYFACVHDFACLVRDFACFVRDFAVWGAIKKTISFGVLLAGCYDALLFGVLLAGCFDTLLV